MKCVNYNKLITTKIISFLKSRKNVINKSSIKYIVRKTYEKRDKMECDNYRGISLPNTAYKIFSKILLKRLMLYVDENIGSYQCSFRKGKSTIDQLSIIGQIIEKRYEYRYNVWQLFIGFKKAYDNVHRESLYNIMHEFGFPRKLIRL